MKFSKTPISRHAEKHKAIITAMINCHMGLTAMADQLNKFGYTAFQGGSWHPNTVKRVIEQLDIQKAKELKGKAALIFSISKNLQKMTKRRRTKGNAYHYEIIEKGLQKMNSEELICLLDEIVVRRKKIS